MFGGSKFRYKKRLHIDRRSQSLKPFIALGEKYKVYLLTRAVLTKNNEFVKYLPNEVVIHILNNRQLYYNSRKNRKGHKKLDVLIENPDEFMDKLKTELDLIEDKLLDEALSKLPFS